MSVPPAVAGGSDTLTTRPLPQAVLTKTATVLGEIKMSQRKDDTTEHDEPSVEERERRQPGSYYDDDATGYELYDPEKDEEEDEEDL